MVSRCCCNRCNTTSTTTVEIQALFCADWLLTNLLCCPQALLERGFAGLMDSQRLPELKVMYQLFQRVQALDEVRWRIALCSVVAMTLSVLLLLLRLYRLFESICGEKW